MTTRRRRRLAGILAVTLLLGASPAALAQEAAPETPVQVTISPTTATGPDRQRVAAQQRA